MEIVSEKNNECQRMKEGENDRDRRKQIENISSLVYNIIKKE